jgi:hypothetical protein
MISPFGRIDINPARLQAAAAPPRMLAAAWRPLPSLAGA